MSYVYDSCAFCLQSDAQCRLEMKRAHERCQIVQGEVLAEEVAACDDWADKEARIACLDAALGRFSDRLDGCLG